MNFKSFVVVAYFHIRFAVADPPTVETKYGTVQGYYKVSSGDRKYIAFEGIPYAKPPVGDLRFEPPQPFGKWNGILLANATYTCAQMLYMPLGTKSGKEDCLYLNIYIPKLEVDKNANWSVIVNIHGGSFMILSPKLGAGEAFIMDRDVIYVNLNYRLGVMGFLCTEDDVVPGNMGLKDQNLAMKWVKENIDAFGGNPNSITLVGLSAGGASVHYHYLSPLSKGLFHRGISASGTALNMWALSKSPMKRAKELADLVQCDYSTTKKLTDCFRKLSADDLLNAEKKLFKVIDTYPSTLFGPVVDKGPDAFLPEHPYKLLTSGQFADLPWLSSHVTEEGVYMYAPFFIANKVAELDEKWEEQIPYALDYERTVKESEWRKVAKDMRDYYFKSQSLNDSTKEMIQLFSDRYFLYDGLEAIRIHAKNSKSPVYYYKYNYDDGLLKIGLKGVAHSDDAKYAFNIVMMPRKLSGEKAAMRDLMVDMVYSYATSGVPTVNGKEFPVFEGTGDDLYIKIDSPTEVKILKLEEFPHQKFWDGLPIIENKKLFSS